MVCFLLNLAFSHTSCCYGAAVVPEIIPASHLAVYRGIYDSIQSGEIDASSHRHDLGGHKEQVIHKEALLML